LGHHRIVPRDRRLNYDTGFINNAGVNTHDIYPDMAWEPKAAFTALADYYRG
jgi:hypothetical protein